MDYLWHALNFFWVGFPTQSEQMEKAYTIVIIHIFQANIAGLVGGTENWRQNLLNQLMLQILLADAALLEWPGFDGLKNVLRLHRFTDRSYILIGTLLKQCRTQSTRSNSKLFALRFPSSSLHPHPANLTDWHTHIRFLHAVHCIVCSTLCLNGGGIVGCTHEICS